MKDNKKGKITFSGKGHDSEKKETKEFIYRTRFDFSDFHYAECLINNAPGFLKYRNGEYEIAKSPIQVSENVFVEPAPQLAAMKNDRLLQDRIAEVIKFPGEPQEYGSEHDLFQEIKDFIDTYVQLRPEDSFILALYTMKSVLFDAIRDSSFPFVHVIAPYGKGKSRLLTVLCEMTPYGFYSIDIKSAALKRVSQLYKPILFVDEKVRMDSDTAAMVNAKYNPNSVIINADLQQQRGTSSLIAYRIFGPMVLAGRGPFDDDAIESKSFQINMDFELTKNHIPRKLKGRELEEFENHARTIRSELLRFRIDWHDKINEIGTSGFLSQYEEMAEPRLFEILSFFDDMIEIMPELKEEIGKVLESQILANVNVARETPNGMIASSLLSIIASGDETITYSANGRPCSGIKMSDIYDEIGQNYKTETGKIIQRLGLKVDYPRIEVYSSKKDETEKKRVKVIRIPSDLKLTELKTRYDSEFVKLKLSAITEARQSNLDRVDKVDKDMQKGYDESTPIENDYPLNPLNPQSLGESENHDSENDFSDFEREQLSESNRRTEKESES